MRNTQMEEDYRLIQAIERSEAIPVHLLIRQMVLDALDAGELSPGDKLPSEPEWAISLKVSRMTLNKAILSLVRDGWLERQKGRGTFVAQRTITKRMEIGVVIAEDLAGAINNYYFGSLYFGLLGCAERLGFGIELLRFQKLVENPTDASRLDGLILINPPLNSVDFTVRVLEGQPEVVVLGASWPGCGLSCVDSDNILGSASAVKHLADLGHKRLAFVGACPQDANSIDRLRGFDLGCQLDNLQTSLVAPWSQGALELSDEAEEFIKSAVQGPEGVTGIVCGGAMIAMHVFRIASEIGLSIPGDLSVVAFDDPSFLKSMPVGVTTLVQPLLEMVEVAMQELIRLHKNPTLNPQIHTRRPELIVRESTASPRQTNEKFYEK
jgi:GntR family transcriptional regulator of arabinose operon